MKEKVTKIGKNTSAINLGGDVYTISTSAAYMHYQHFDDFKNDWEANPAYVMGKKIVSYGAYNNLPEVISEVMMGNNIAPGIIERQIGLLHGQGVGSFRLEYTDGQIMRNYVEDKEILNWIRPWIRRYIGMAEVEYQHMKGIFPRYYKEKSHRLLGLDRTARDFISRIEIVPSTDARLGFPEQGKEHRIENVKTIYTGDFSNHCLRSGITTYPVFDPMDPFKHNVSMSYNNTYTFAHNFYSLPSYYGTLGWLYRSSEIPDIIKYLVENGISMAYHIHSPSEYWEKIEMDLTMQEENRGKPAEYIKQKLEELKDELLDSISLALAGKKNAGKFFHTVDFLDPMGNRCEWKVEAIDQKLKDFIEAQIKISEAATNAATSGMNLHPSLANVMVNGKMSPGSEMLYALKLYLSTDVSIPEEVIFEPINQAIAANWPDKDIKLGYYRNIVQREENVSPSERVSTNV